MHHRVLIGLAVAILLTLHPARAETVLDFSSNAEEFVAVDTAGTVLHSTSIGAGSMALTNPTSWKWRAKRMFNKTGTEAAKYHAFANELANAGIYGGTLHFDLILLKNTAITNKTSSFSGVEYNILIKQTPPSGSGWVQIDLPAKARISRIVWGRSRSGPR